MGKTKIEWCSDVWNPLVGCTHAGTPGCDRCYAARMAARFSKPGLWGEGLAEMTKGSARWTGKINFVESKLDLPLRWKKPCRIFVNSMSDLFHENVPDEWVDRIFAVMALCDGRRGTRFKASHIFQVLTKRSERMRAYLSDPETPHRIASWICHDHTVKGYRPTKNGCDWRAWEPWPLPNVWLGVSAEDQKTADERIPLLLRTPAAVRWISAEPLLEPIDLSAWRCGSFQPPYDRPGIDSCGRCRRPSLMHFGRRLDWVVVGGESGPGARPMHPQWAISLRDQCVTSGIKFLFKQQGAWMPIHAEDPLEWGKGEMPLAPDGTDLRGHEASASPVKGDVVLMRRVGKKAAGRMLAGQEWNEYPKQE